MFTIPESAIYFVNPLLILLFLFVLYRGYKRGFILQLLDLVSIGVAAMIAWLFAPVFSRVMPLVAIGPTTMPSIDAAINDALNQLVWFGILLIVIRIILLVVTPLATMISKMPLVKQVNSLIGGVFSVMVYGVYLFILILFLTLPIVRNGNMVIERTALNPIQKAATPIYQFIGTGLSQNIALQTILSQRSLTDQQEDQIVYWLQSQGFTQAAIQEFLARYE